MIAIIQARLGSQRYPGKALATMPDGRTMINWVAERVRKTPGVRVVALATVDGDRLALSSAAAPFVNVTMACPDLADADVLGRFWAVVTNYWDHAQTIMRVTGDCPLWKPEIAAEVHALFRNTAGCQYASNIAPGYVDGEDVEIFTREALQQAHEAATHEYDREHVTSWMRANLPNQATLLPLKTSIDTPDDLARVLSRLEIERGIYGGR